MVIWVIKNFFLYFIYIFLLLLLNISASVRSIPSLFFVGLIFVWNVPLVSPVFLKRSLVFSILLFSSISFHWSLRKAFSSLLDVLWNSAFKWVYLSSSTLPLTSLLLSSICKASSDDHFAFLHSFSWGWSWSLPPVQCHEPPSIILQAICLSDLIPWIYWSLPLYNHKGFDLSHTWVGSDFSYFLQFKSALDPL